jgi:hypothetical protein
MGASFKLGVVSEPPYFSRHPPFDSPKVGSASARRGLRCGNERSKPRPDDVPVAPQAVMNVRQTLEFPQRVTDDGRQCIPSYSRKFVSAETRARLEHLVAPHVDSFDYFLDSGLRAAVQDLPTYELKVGVTGLGQGMVAVAEGGGGILGSEHAICATTTATAPCRVRCTAKETAPRLFSSHRFFLVVCPLLPFHAAGQRSDVTDKV